MELAIKKWGNSAGIRIPASIMEEAQLTLNVRVSIRQENGRIIIERASIRDLNKLLSAITPENLHGEIYFGASIGKEAF